MSGRVCGGGDALSVALSLPVSRLEICHANATDRTPLLPNGSEHPRSFGERVRAVVSPENGPTWAHSVRFFFLGTWFNVFLVFVPLSFIAHHLNWDAGLRFLFSFLAILPLAKACWERRPTNAELGDTLAGLLNASFGNAVEIIVGVAALLQGELRIVQTSMLGSILSNLLLVLGCSFLAGGLKFQESNFQVTAAQTSSSLMTLSVITLVIPAAYHASKANESEPFNGGKLTSLAPPNPDDRSLSGLLTISRGTAIILLLMYIAYLYFQLKSHASLFEAEASEDDESHGPEMNAVSAGVALLAVTVITSFCADYLVASIEETAERYSIPKPFIGLILIPIVANAAEHVTSIWMAMKNKMELTIGICVGSSIQIATFVVPLLVIVGWITGHELTLFFANFETIVLFVSVLLVNLLVQDGKSNYMEGLMLVSLYIVIALAFWVS
ncbi:Calcium/proton exchanger [Exidia glandulosa HHB12029]|uniref:Vacuolar calcium ion transporter n=1 Tax=Exidia glandulosa HHB12029 TaxID=1314781 RepID=A0A165EPG3_EXIGL|nr:Calcium/proton exchanger [Exidia glandulosa HHB12029]